MTKKTRRRIDVGLKAKIALEAVREQGTVADRLMGIAALRPKPRTSKPAPGHKIYPYLFPIDSTRGTMVGAPQNNSAEAASAIFDVEQRSPNRLSWPG